MTINNNPIASVATHYGAVFGATEKLNEAGQSMALQGLKQEGETCIYDAKGIEKPENMDEVQAKAFAATKRGLPAKLNLAVAEQQETTEQAITMLNQVGTEFLTNHPEMRVGLLRILSSNKACLEFVNVLAAKRTAMKKDPALARAEVRKYIEDKGLDTGIADGLISALFLG